MPEQFLLTPNGSVRVLPAHFPSHHPTLSRNHTNPPQCGPHRLLLPHGHPVRTHLMYRSVQPVGTVKEHGFLNSSAHRPRGRHCLHSIPSRHVQAQFLNRRVECLVLVVRDLVLLVHPPQILLISVSIFLKIRLFSRRVLLVRGYRPLLTNLSNHRLSKSLQWSCILTSQSDIIFCNFRSLFRYNTRYAASKQTAWTRISRHCYSRGEEAVQMAGAGKFSLWQSSRCRDQRCIF